MRPSMFDFKSSILQTKIGNCRNLDYDSSNMNEKTKERRRVSHVSLVDTAMRSANQLFASKDANTRSAASRVLSDLQKLRAEMPNRRQDDGRNKS
jgi:hypothetical protein